MTAQVSWLAWALCDYTLEFAMNHILRLHSADRVCGDGHNIVWH